MEPNEREKFNEMLKILLNSRVDCRQFNNLKIVFLSEDKEAKCKQ